MGLLTRVKDSLGSARKLWDWKRFREFGEVKSKILRHAERAQAREGGAYWHTAETLLQHGVIEPKQVKPATRALQRLVVDGYFEYQEGRYYLKGHAPNYPSG